MKKIYKIRYLAMQLIAIICFGLAACVSSGSGSSGEETFNDVWKLTQETWRCTSQDVASGDCSTAGQLVTDVYPRVAIYGDYDYDGTFESVAMNGYITLTNSTERIFVGINMDDPGSDTSTFPGLLSEAGIPVGTFYCPDYDFTFTVNGNTYTDQYGYDITVEFSEDGNTMTMTNPDDTGEVEIYTRLDSITASENCEWFDQILSDKSSDKDIKRIPRLSLRHL